MVRSFNFATGEWVLAEVERRIDNNYNGALITITTGQSKIETTVNHPFWVIDGEKLTSRSTPHELSPGENEGQELAGRWVSSQELRAGDLLIGQDGLQRHIERIEQQYAEALPVSNLTVKEYHNYAVGTNAILVHNAWCDILRRNGKLASKALQKAGAKLDVALHGHHCKQQSENEARGVAHAA